MRQFVVMAQGDSGTHVVFHALCNTGIPAVLWGLKCDSPKASGSSQLQVVNRSSTKWCETMDTSKCRDDTHHTLMYLYHLVLSPESSPQNLAETIVKPHMR